MTTSTVPTMPVPRALESLVGLVHPPDADIPEVPVRHVLAAIANAVGGQLTEHLKAMESPTTSAGIWRWQDVHADLLMAAQALDDLVDAYDRVYPNPDDDIGAFP